MNRSRFPGHSILWTAHGKSILILYDTNYQKRYSGLLEDREDSNREGSPINFASQLEGKLLTLSLHHPRKSKGGILFEMPPCRYCHGQAVKR